MILASFGKDMVVVEAERMYTGKQPKRDKNRYGV